MKPPVFLLGGFSVPVLALVASLVATSAQAQLSSTSMSCGNAPAGGTSNCGLLTVSSASIYPEHINNVFVSNPVFTVLADNCSGHDLLYGSCTVSVGFIPSSSAAAGAITASLTINYSVCAYDGSGAQVCNGSTQKILTVTGSVSSSGGPVDGTPVSVPATNNTSPPAGKQDDSNLPNCRVNQFTQQYCVVVPLQ